MMKPKENKLKKKVNQNPVTLLTAGELLWFEGTGTSQPPLQDVVATV